MAEPANYLSRIEQTRQALTALFVPQRLDWFEVCSFAGGMARNPRGENNNPPAIVVSEIGAGHQATSEKPSDRATPIAIPAMPPLTLISTASARNCSSTCSRRADRHAQSELARTLGDRHQQDVHDVDAADQQ